MRDRCLCFGLTLRLHPTLEHVAGLLGSGRTDCPSSTTHFTNLPVCTFFFSHLLALIGLRRGIGTFAARFLLVTPVEGDFAPVGCDFEGSRPVEHWSLDETSSSAAELSGVVAAVAVLFRFCRRLFVSSRRSCTGGFEHLMTVLIVSTVSSASAFSGCTRCSFWNVGRVG